MAARVVWPGRAVERGLWAAGICRVAGVDEVGMGPLAGPVVAAAVMFEPEQRGTVARHPDGVRDSKTLTPGARQRVAGQIRLAALAIGIGVVESNEIDRINIYQAGLRAMRLAVDGLSVRPDYVLVDGRDLPGLPYPQRKLVKGDQNVYSVAAASVVAKVHRDALMVGLDSRYPGYGFGKHRGYGTTQHREALRRLGPCPIHRRSFRLL